MRRIILLAGVLAMAAMAAAIWVKVSGSSTAQYEQGAEAPSPSVPAVPTADRGVATTEEEDSLNVPPDPAGTLPEAVVDAKLEMPLLDWNKRLAFSTANDKNFRDVVARLRTRPNLSYLINGSYDAAMHRATYLLCVRRLLAIEREFPGTVTPVVVVAYAKVLEAWPAAYRDWTRRYSEGDFARYEPIDVDKAEMRAVAATYLMGESGDPALLGVLLDGYQTHQEWLAEYKRAGRTQCPVPPAFTLYAIHRLVSTTSEDRLRSEEARSARKTYLSWAENHIPPAAEVEVSAWNSERDKPDPLMIADTKNVLLRDQSKIVMTVYPSHFKDGTVFELSEMPDLSQLGEEWHDRLFAAARAIIER